MINIVGAGIYGCNHITLETDQILRESSVVFHLTVSPELVDYLGRVNRNVVSLVPLYRDGRLDLEVYAEITQTVIDASSQHPSVSLVVVGHPMLYVTPTVLISDRCRAEGRPFRILAGVSAIDTMMLGLGLDLGQTGLQVYDVNRLITYGIAPSDRVPLILFQIGTFGTGFITRGQTNDPRRFDVLVKYLAQYYPASHPVLIVESRMSEQHAGTWLWMPLSELGANAARINYNSSMYVPPAQRLEVQDGAFLSQLADPRVVAGMLQGEE